MKTKRGWGSHARAMVIVTFSFGALLACGTKNAAPAQTEASTSGASATSWADLCKLADTRAKTCSVKNNLVGVCASHAADCGDIYDKSAYPILSKCLAEADCNACATAAKASPSPAGKTLMDALAEHEKRCGTPSIDSVMHPLFSEAGAKELSACESKSDCAQELKCLATLDPKQTNLCQETLGLLYPNLFHQDVAGSASNSPPPPPPPPPAPVGDVTGQPAPEFSTTSLSLTVAVPPIASLKGKVVILHFWASWCVPCNKSLPMLEAFAKKHKNVVVVGINEDDSTDDATKFLKTIGVTYPNAADPQKQTAHDYGVATMPETIVIDAKGNVSKIFPGSGVTERDLKKLL